METFYEILPDSLQEEQCGLLCVIGINSISFCIKDLTVNRFLGVAVYNYDRKNKSEDFHKQVGKLFNVKPYLSLPFKRIRVVYFTAKNILVPARLYDVETLTGLLKLQLGVDVEEASVMTDEIAGHDYLNCYRISGGIKRLIDRQYPVKTSFHYYTLWINSHRLKGDNFYIIFYARTVMISLFLDGKCILINQYPYEKPEDISYYLLGILNQNNREDIPLEISGYIEKESSAFVELRKYFEKITFSTLPAASTYFENILTVPPHYFSHLFELEL